MVPLIFPTTWVVLHKCIHESVIPNISTVCCYCYSSRLFMAVHRAVKETDTGDLQEDDMSHENNGYD